MPSSYTRNEIQPGCVEFIVKAAAAYSRWPKWAVIAAVLFALYVVGSIPTNAGFFNWAFHWIFAIGGAWLVFRGVKWFIERRGGGVNTFTVSTQGVQTPTAEVIPREEVHSLLW